MKNLVFGKNVAASIAEAYASAKKVKADSNVRQAAVRVRRAAENHAAALPKFVAAYKAAAIAQAEKATRDAELTAELQAFVNNDCKAIVTADVESSNEVHGFNFELQRFADAGDKEFVVRTVRFKDDGLDLVWDKGVCDTSFTGDVLEEDQEILVPERVKTYLASGVLTFNLKMSRLDEDEHLHGGYEMDFLYNLENNDSYVSNVRYEGVATGSVVSVQISFFRPNDVVDLSIENIIGVKATQRAYARFHVEKVSNLNKLLFFKKHGIGYDVNKCSERLTCEHAFQLWEILGEEGAPIAYEDYDGGDGINVDLRECQDALRSILENQDNVLDSFWQLPYYQKIVDASLPIPEDEYEIFELRDIMDYLHLTKFTVNKQAVMDALLAPASAKTSTIQEILESAFKYRFHRVPRVIYDMAILIHSTMKTHHASWTDVFEFIESFVPKVLAANLQRYSKEDAITLAFIMPNDRRPAYDIKAITYAYEHKLIDSDAHEWLMQHRTVSYDNCMLALTHEGLSFEDIHNVEELKAATARQDAESEIQEFEEEYGVSFKGLTSSIEKNTVSDGQDMAEMLNPTDPEQVMLGYYTYCCQHMGGAGETAMAYGLISDNGGFFVVRRRGQIIAQAESWLAKEDSTLVFDNIELANDREVKTIFPILKKWLENSNYRNVVMGLGYNEVGEAIDLPEAPIPTFRDLDEIEEKTEWVYTDADEACVYLKKDGKVMF